MTTRTPRINMLRGIPGEHSVEARQLSVRRRSPGVRDRLTREKQLPISAALRIESEVASVLDYANRRGVIYRDIEPENILLHGGQAVVADF